MAHRKPLGDVVENARKEPGFRRTEQKAHQVKTLWPLYECHADGDGAPREHDARKPAPGAETVEHQVAGNLEQEVANEEQPRTQTVRGVTNADVGAHVQLGKADCRAVHVGDQVQQDQEGNQFQRDAPNKPQFLAHGGRSPIVVFIEARGTPLAKIRQGHASVKTDYIVGLFTKQHFQSFDFALMFSHI